MPEKCAARLNCVITQKINRLAHFGDGVWQRFSGLADNEAEQFGHSRLHQIGGARKTGGAFCDGNRSPAGRGERSVFHGCINLRGRCLADLADYIGMIRRIGDGPEAAANLATCKHGRCRPFDFSAFR